MRIQDPDLPGPDLDRTDLLEKITEVSLGPRTNPRIWITLINSGGCLQSLTL